MSAGDVLSGVGVALLIAVNAWHFYRRGYKRGHERGVQAERTARFLGQERRGWMEVQAMQDRFAEQFNIELVKRRD